MFFSILLPFKHNHKTQSPAAKHVFFMASPEITKCLRELSLVNELQKQ